MSLNLQRGSRASVLRTPPAISNPIPQDPILPVSIAKAVPVASTPAPKNRSSMRPSSKLHRPSLTSPMNWLGRSSSSAGNAHTSYTPSKSRKISDPQLQSNVDTLTRSGPLGAGATVVRTPQEALSVGRSDAISVRSTETLIPEEDEDIEEAGIASPPLPPLPLEEDSTTQREPRRSGTPPCPTRAVPTTPAFESSPEPSPAPSLRPSLKMLDSFPPVPALPANVPSIVLPPPFDPILISGMPILGVADRRKVIVTVETCTEAFKVTLGTLCSRPSFLASYLQSQLPPPSPASPSVEDEASVYSRHSEVEDSFHSIFRNHLTTSGLLPLSSAGMHIFLDRPSAPYTHIFAYLRTPLSTPEHPAGLPRAVQLTTTSSSRLEALLELRDEAKYLNMEELYDLCCNELRARHYLALTRGSQHARGMSNASMSAGSVRSLGTLRENDEIHETVELPGSKRLSKDSGNGSSCSSGASSYSQRGRSPAGSMRGEIGWQSPTPTLVADQQFQTTPIRKAPSPRTLPAADWI